MSTTDPVNPIDPAIAHESDVAIGPASVKIGPWRKRLVLFQRVAGGSMILKGLVFWAGLFGLGGDFRDQAMAAQASTVFFAVIDLAAGVALWLGSAWGASLWFVAVAAQIVANMLYLEHSGLVVLLTLLQIVLIAVYVLMRFMAHSEKQKRE
jgi:hypothetical protein